MIGKIVSLLPFSILGKTFNLSIKIFSLVINVFQLTTILFRVSHFFSFYSVFNEHFVFRLFSLTFIKLWTYSTTLNTFKTQGKSLVGPSGLEPPTSCLSGTRSNHLSYEPILALRAVKSEEWRIEVDFRFAKIFLTYSLLPITSYLNHVGGDDGIRTHDPLLAGQVLSQLSYTPVLLRFGFSWRIPQNWTTNQRRISCATGLVYPCDIVSIERRWSSRTFRYGYLVTT